MSGNVTSTNTTSLGSSYTSTNAQAGLGTINAQGLVFHIDILLCAIIGAFVLFRLPRAAARLSKWYEWKDGLVLYYTRFSSLKSRMRYTDARKHSVNLRTRPDVGPHENKGDMASDDSHLNLVARHGSSSAGHGKHRARYTHSKPDNFPRHIPSSNFRFLQSVSADFCIRISPGISLGQLFIILMYIAIVCYATFFRSNPFTDPLRTGLVAMSQIPIVVAFATKNNVIGSLTGVGYERLNLFHRVTGRCVFIAANVHSLGYIYKWQIQGTFSQNIRSPENAWGFVALASIDIIAFFSTSNIRRRFHNLFLSTHIVAAILFIVATYKHRPATAPYIYATCAIYGLDRIVMRSFKTRIARAVIFPIPELGVTRVEIPSINAGWRAGQHVRLQVLSSRMGAFGWMEVHPLTIASVSVTGGGGRGGEGMVLMCKKAGKWTNRLYDLAKTGGYEAGDSEDARRIVSVAVEGPYGGPGNTVFSSFSAAAFIVGGSGVTFGLSVMQDIVQREIAGRSRVKVLEFIWIVQDPASVTPLLPILTSLIQQSNAHPLSLSLSISIYYTRISRSPEKRLSFLDKFKHPNLQFIANRPHISKILERVIDKSVQLRGVGDECTKDDEANQGLIVGICGPAGLGGGVVKEVGKIPWAKRHAVGGVEIHEEAFGM